MPNEVSELVHFPEEFMQEIKDLIRAMHVNPRPVNEYKSSTLAPDSESLITLQPQFARMPIRIDTVLVMGPAIQDASTQQLTGSQTTPPANTTIVSFGSAALIPGMTYQVNWTVSLDGTPSGTDANNFFLRQGASNILASQNDGAIGRYPQQAVTFVAPTTGGSIVVRSGTSAATSGAIYTATLSLTPLGYMVTIQLGDHIWPNLTLPSDGVLKISPKCLILQPRDLRQLFANTPAQYYFGLFGYADVPTDIR